MKSEEILNKENLQEEIENSPWFNKMRDDANKTMELVNLLKKTSDDEFNSFRTKNIINDNRKIIDNIEEAIEKNSFSFFHKIEDEIYNLYKILRDEIIQKYKTIYKNNLNNIEIIIVVMNEYDKNINKEIKEIKEKMKKLHYFTDLEEIQRLNNKSISIFNKFKENNEHLFN